MMKLASLILLLSLLKAPQEFNDRRIIVISASKFTSEINDQIDSLKKSSKGLKERKLAVFTQIDGEIKAIFNTTEQSKKFVEKNKAKYVASSTPEIYLIGLDKTIKQKFTKFVYPRQVFAIVDNMPMRRAEMRRN